MNKFSFLGKRFYFLLFLFLPILVFAIINFKLPFENEIRMALTRGYSDTTHVGKDKFAIDFALGGCKSWDLSILAITSGTVIKSDVGHVNGEKNSYGNQVMIEHYNGVISRYAHLNQVFVSVGDHVEQGQKIATMGNTGSCEGSACKEHPGTHLHFAMYQKDASGNLTPYKPEPMSGYINFTAGEWYTSDNELYDPNKKVEEPVEESQEKSLWGKIKEIFNFGDDSVNSENTQELKNILQNVETETDYENKVAEAEEAKIYTLSFTNPNQIIEVEPGTEVNVKVEAKNTGTAIWEGKNISANVVGGLVANNDYYHPTWLTSLRPAVLDQAQLPPGEIGSFSFTINTPTVAGEYTFRIQLVRVDNSFSYIEGGVWTVKLNISEKEIEKKEKELEKIIEPEDIKISEIPVEESLGVKIKNEIEEVYEGIKETVKKIFYGGGTSSPAVEQNDTNQNSVNENLPEIIITIPTSTYTNIATTTICGTKNEYTNFVYVNTSSADIITEISWQKIVQLDEGSNIFDIYGENEKDRTTTSTLEIFLDTTAPSILGVSLIQNEFATPTIFASWESEDAGIGVDYFDVQYKINDGEWTVDATSTTSTDFSMPAEKFNKYSIRVRACDKLGNISDWIETGDVVVDWSKSVVVNEVAWMGTGPSAKQKNDEWIELYNNTDSDIDLTDWHILIDDKLLTISKIINPIIPARGYLLLERTDDTTVVCMNGDMFFTGAISNDKGKIILKDNLGEIIDELDFSNGWPAGSILNNQYRSMFRIDSGKPGSWGNNWQTTVGIDPVTNPDGGGNIFGSPKRDNKGGWLLTNLDVYYSEQFDNNVMTLTKEHSPYIFSGLKIPLGYTLKIEPGVILYGKYDFSYINIDGNLIIEGIEDSPVVFTSALDTNYVEQNLSVLAGELAPGDWSRIAVSSGGNLEARNVKFLYGGKKFFVQGGFVFGGKYVSRVIDNQGGVVRLENAEFNQNFFDVDSDDLDYSSVIWSEVSPGGNASTTVINSYFSDGWVAVKDKHNFGSTGYLFEKIINNTFSNFISESGAIQLGGSQSEVGSNIFVNGTNNIFSRDVWSLVQNETLVEDMEYHFGSISVPEGLILFVNPGVKIKMKGGGITINGSLQAVGTFDNPISILNQDGFSWNALNFLNSTSSLEYVQISRGGYQPIGSHPMVWAENSNLIFGNVDLFNPANNDNILYLKNSTASWFGGNIFRNNFNSDSKGIKVEGGSLVLDNVQFSGFGKAIEMYAGGSLTLNNMNEDNFQDILTYKWWPKTAWSFGTSTATST